MRLDSLEVGERFVIPGLDNKAGVVHHQSAGGTTVRFEGSRKNQIKDKLTGDVTAEWDTPNKPIQISGGTEVERA